MTTDINLDCANQITYSVDQVILTDNNSKPVWQLTILYKIPKLSLARYKVLKCLLFAWPRLCGFLSLLEDYMSKVVKRQSYGMFLIAFFQSLWLERNNRISENLDGDPEALLGSKFA